MDVPLFPLHTVLCPGIALPLHIFEPRYRAMVARCLAGDRRFGVVWIREGRDVGPGELTVATVGTFAEIREAERFADGRYALVAVGTGRFRLDEARAGVEPYLVGRVTPLEDPTGDERTTRRLARLVNRRFVRYVGRVRELADAWADDAAAEGATSGETVASMVGQGGPTSTEHLGIPDDPTLLSHLLAGIVETDLSHRQALLEAETTEVRLVELANLLAREVAYLEQELRHFALDPRLPAARRN